MGKPWKELEKKAASVMGGTRINRAADYGISDVDVVLPDFPGLKIDCKVRRRHAHHALVEEIREKYCKSGGSPVLVTKHGYSHREYVTVDLDLFVTILDSLRQISHNNLNEEFGAKETARSEVAEK